jgi:outer membrane protein OmpA-like peptidoglycan-associated protein
VLFVYGCAAILVASYALAASAVKVRQLAKGESARLSGLILSRDGDLIRVHDKKSSEVVVIRIDNATKVKRTRFTFPFYRHVDMDVTALLPGLNIEAEGVGNFLGQLEAHKIYFSPDDLSSQAKSSAEQAQNSADNAQNPADQAAIAARTTVALGLADSVAAAGVNPRVSYLDVYKNEFEVDVFFPEGSTVIGETAKKDLANLADIAKSLNGYMIEISGYAAHYKFSTAKDQRLSEERAAAVARYFLEVRNIPMRRILVPVGYGATHPAASNQNAQGRGLNRHVNIRVLVNNGVGLGM